MTVHLEAREDPRSYDDFGGYEVPIEPLPESQSGTDVPNREGDP